VDRTVGLEGVRTDFAFMQTPDGHGRLELIKFHTPSHQGDKRHAPANTPGIRNQPQLLKDHIRENGSTTCDRLPPVATSCGHLWMVRRGQRFESVRGLIYLLQSRGFVV
jgi:hypothetical protein